MITITFINNSIGIDLASENLVINPFVSNKYNTYQPQSLKVYIATKSTYDYMKVFMMSDIQQRDDNVHIENDGEGTAGE